MKDSTRTSYGEAYYDFTVNVTAPAIFELGTDQIEHGDFVVITGKNVEDGSEINFSSFPDIGYNPVFFGMAAMFMPLFRFRTRWNTHPVLNLQLSVKEIQQS